MNRTPRIAVCALLAGFIAAEGARADDLFHPGVWAALASDRPAERVGDTITVIVDQNSTALNSARSGSSKSTKVGGQVTATESYNRAAALSLSGDFSGAGQTGRSDRLLAEIGVVVDAVLPNGDLHVSGEQTLNINGERVKIRIRGRLRRADIAANNTVRSTRLADASIDYDGAGFTSRSARPGIVDRIFNWLGIL